MKTKEITRLRKHNPLNSFFSILLALTFISANPAPEPKHTEIPVSTHDVESDRLLVGFENLRADGLSFDAYRYAVIGYRHFKKQGLVKSDTVVIIDFDLPSTAERMFIIDMKNNVLIDNTLVAHGKNTGNNRAVNFSNKEGSLQSSLGFYLTGETYVGKHGFSLRLDGLEPGVNDNARSRNIVIHSADYATYSFIEKHQRLGRSFGCPAIPPSVHREIINTIKDGNLLFIYSSKAGYKPTFVQE